VKDSAAETTEKKLKNLQQKQPAKLPKTTNNAIMFRERIK
jgi:hypothetical protein